MSAEFYVVFESAVWLDENRSQVEAEIAALRTFDRRAGQEFWLRGLESRSVPDAWDYDVRILLDGVRPTLVEVGAHPETIERDLADFFGWLKSRTSISVQDEDGVPSGWCK